MAPAVTMLTPYKICNAPEMSGIGDSALNWYSRRLAHELERVGTSVRIIGPRAEHNEASLMG